MQRARQHLRANFVGYVALVVALIGVPTAWAALAKNTVGTKQLKRNAVTRSKIALSAVNSAKVADGSLRASDFASGQLPSGPRGQQGPPGQDGTPLRAVAWVAGGGTPSFQSEIPVRGFASVDNVDTGVYCLTPSGDFHGESDPPIVTVEYSVSSGENFTAMWDETNVDCDAGQYETKTYKATDSTATDDASFAVMVP